MSATTVHVRFTPASATSYNSDIVHVSGAASQGLSLAGTGIEEVTGLPGDLANDIALYPNPVHNGAFTLNIPSGKKAKVSVIATNGSVKTSNNVSGKATLDVADLNNGLYVVRVIMDSEVTTQKIVIRK